MIVRKAAVVSAGAILVVSILFVGVMSRNGTTVVQFEGFSVRTIAIENVNVHLVTAGDNTFLVEAGDRSSFEKIVSEIRAAGVEPSSLRAVVVTHGHADHFGGAKSFQDEFNVPVIGGRGDLALFHSGRSGKICPTSSFVRIFLDERSKARTAPPFTPDILISETTSTKDLLGFDGEIVPLPGHTEGSIVINLGEAALVGDLLRGGLLSPTSAQTHFYMCDLQDNESDVGQLLHSISANATHFFTGHMGPVSRQSVISHFEPPESSASSGCKRCPRALAGHLLARDLAAVRRNGAGGPSTARSN